MNIQNKNIVVLKKICKLCDRIDLTVKRFGGQEAFESDFDYQDAIYLKVFQIGELVRRFSDEYKDSTKSSIEWNKVKGIRNFIAHEYDLVDCSTIWDTITNDIPMLKSFCEEQIQMEDKG